MSTPPRQTGRKPPTRRITISRQRERKTVSALPRYQTRGSMGKASRMTTGSIQLRCIAQARM